MARLHLEIPANLSFSTDIPVRITDINYGGHLGNDALLSLIHEARCRFLQQHGFTEMNTAGVGLIMVDAAIVYKREVFHGDTLHFEVGIADPGRTGFDFLYRITKRSTGELAAEAKTGMAFFDYQQHKLRRMPEKFAVLFGPGPKPE